MAPKRGGGSSSSSGGSTTSSCPGAFATSIQQVYFAQDVVFFVVFLGIAIALCSFRKKSVAGKKLLGIPYILTISFFLLEYACSIVATILQECGTTDYHSYYSWQVVIAVFIYLGYWLLLLVVVYTLPMMLQKQLGHSSSIFKAILLGIVGVMGALTCVIMGVTCYLNWAQSQPYWYRNRSIRSILPVKQKIRMAYVSLYLLGVIVSGGFSLKTILSLRSRRNPAGDLIGWIVALMFSMVLWVVLSVVFASWTLQDINSDWEVNAALSWLASFGQALSCIFLLCIAKHMSWRNAPITEPMSSTDAYAHVAHQPQYASPHAYNAHPNLQQAYYYQQAPTHNGTAMPVQP